MKSTEIGTIKYWRFFFVYTLNGREVVFYQAVCPNLDTEGLFHVLHGFEHKRRTIPNGIGVVTNPIAKDQDTLLIAQCHIDQQMSMAENIEIHFGMSGTMLFGKANQPFVFYIEVVVAVGVGDIAECLSLQIGRAHV